MSKKQKKKIYSSEAASHVLCPSFVCKLPHECEDITKNAWRAPLNAQCNIEYRLQYSLFFTFVNYHQNRLFLNFLVNYRISIISFFVGGRGIDFQPWLLFMSRPTLRNAVYRQVTLIDASMQLFWSKLLRLEIKTFNTKTHTRDNCVRGCSLH